MYNIILPSYYGALIKCRTTFRAWRSAGHLRSVCLAYWSWL